MTSRWSKWWDPRRGQPHAGALEAQPHGMTRRAVLTGAGVALALPVLPSLLGGRTANAAATGSVPWIAIQVPNGRLMDRWTPQTTGVGFAWTPSLAPFAPFRSRTTVLSGLTNEPAMDGVPGTHAREYSCWLTNHEIPPMSAGVVENGWSVDQRIGDARATQSGRPPLVAAINPGPPVDAVSGCIGYSCVFYSTPSWRGNTPVPPLDGLDATWRAVFGDPTQRAMGPGHVARRDLWRRSMLDSMTSDIAALKQRVGREDSLRIDEFTTSLRALERRVSTPPVQTPEPPLELRDANSLRMERQNLLSILRFALEMGLADVLTVVLDLPGGGPVWSELGATEDHHALSHHGSAQARLDQLARIELAQSEVVAGFLAELDEAAGFGGGRSLLDESVVLFGSGNSDGDHHLFDNLPNVLFGGAGGRLRGGEHLVLQRPLADLHLTTAHVAGVDLGTHGDSTGLIEELLA